MRAPIPGTASRIARPFAGRAGAMPRHREAARRVSRVAPGPDGTARARRVFCNAVGLFAVLLSVAGGPARAERTAAETATICDAAAAQAARESGVPLAVLQAITRTETGRRRGGQLQPWPWTVNMEGAGVWFDTEDEARAYVFRHHQRGARSYDVGCFQLNYRWHGQAFASLEEMFEPLANARYAARFLSELHAETGDWSRAAGAYHSRTKKYSDRYRARFDQIVARLDGAPPPAQTALNEPAATAAPQPPAPPPPDAPRVNTFPLLQAASAPAAMGSLVPLGVAGGRRMFDPPAEDARTTEDGDAG